MSNQENAYWLNLSIDEFRKRVWDRGLSKFALDLEDEELPAIYTFSDYFITLKRVSPTKINVTIELRSPDPSAIVLFFFSEYPEFQPEVSVWEISPAIELLEEVCELWSENLFVLSEQE